MESETVNAQAVAELFVPRPEVWPEQWAFQYWKWMEYNSQWTADRWVCFYVGGFETEEQATKAGNRHSTANGGPVRIIRIPGSDASKGGKDGK
jgi:hypothetical protein